MPTGIEVVRLAKHQIREAGQALGRAFHDYPVAKWCCPDEAKRVPRLKWYMTFAVRYGHTYGGEVYITAGRVDGAAIWLPPGEFPMGNFRLLRAGMILAPLRLGPAVLARFMRYSDYVEQLHRQDTPPRHWYLQRLGVEPSRQGQGIGSALMEPVLARADADGLPCYLETEDARNLPLYRRHGFEVMTEGDVPKGAPHVWTMVRPPRG